jgi:hypothetical protein
MPARNITMSGTGKPGKDDKKAPEPPDPIFPLYWFFIVLNLLVSILGIAIWVIAP